MLFYLTEDNFTFSSSSASGWSSEQIIILLLFLIPIILLIVVLTAIWRIHVSINNLAAVQIRQAEAFESILKEIKDFNAINLVLTQQADRKNPPYNSSNNT